MNNLKSLIVVVACICATGLLLYPGYYWWHNPELTQMQVFKAFWHYYAAFCVISLCLPIGDKNNEK